MTGEKDATLTLLMDAEEHARTLMDTAVEVWKERVRDLCLELASRVERSTR